MADRLDGTVALVNSSSVAGRRATAGFSRPRRMAVNEMLVRPTQREN